MKSNFKKLALAAALSGGLAGVSTNASAIIEGAAGEALLVPLTVWDGIVNTVVQVTVPDQVGFDTVPNFYTAPNTTPGNMVGNKIHWYFFDKKSVHRLNGTIPVTPNQLVTIDWSYLVQTMDPTLVNVEGYLVIATEAARTGAAANFDMMGDAFLVAFPFDAKIPVLPMSDGKDPSHDAAPTVDNNVVYGLNKIPNAVSPLASGIRTNYSNGVADVVRFDLTLGNRTNSAPPSITNLPTLLVVWSDGNYDAWGNQSVDVFDDAERSCSTNVSVDQEVNTILVNWPDLPPLPWIDQTNNLCYPGGFAPGSKGFVEFTLPEPIDNNIDAPETAAVAFSIMWAYEPTSGTFLPYETALAHERGLFH